ncbi:Hypothetical predicted protein, partial [Mytilus galloprovincialis]
RLNPLNIKYDNADRIEIKFTSFTVKEAFDKTPCEVESIMKLKVHINHFGSDLFLRRHDTYERSQETVTINYERSLFASNAPTH